MTLRNLGIFLGTLVAATLVGPSAVFAGTVTTTVNGHMGATGQGCLQLLTMNVSESENCLYNGGPVVNVPLISPNLYPPGESTGPFSQEAFYDSAATPQAFSVNYVQAKGDGKVRQLVNGTVTVDDNGTVSGTDDLISLTVTMRSPGSGDVIRQLGSTNNSAEDKYTTMTQVLAPYHVDSATHNAAGGYDYVIGSAGFPTRLTFADPYDVDPSTANPAGTPGASPCNGEMFGDMECSASFAAPFVIDPLRWTPWSSPGSGRPGLSRMEGNIGARTVGTLTGLQCIDTGVNNACRSSKVSFAPRVNGPNQAPGGGITAEDVGWDDLYLKVSTDASGHVISLAGFPLQEYQVFGQQTYCSSDPGAIINCNSWLAEYFDGNGVFAGNDSVRVDANTSVDISVMANDHGFTDPVTVTLDTTGTTQGTAVVSGSPGPASGISVRYTASPTASGSDSFTYTVTDGTYTMTATVTLLISGAIDDSASTNPNTPVDINVAANDILLGSTATVTLVSNAEDPSSFNNGGHATVTAGNGGPLAGIVVTYTPRVTDLCPSEDTETFKYRIDDGVLPISTATVTVRLNLAPVATDGTMTLSTQGSDPTIVNGTFLAPGTGTGACLGNQGAGTPVSIVANPARGTATASGNQITYQIDDPLFFHGTDSFTYQIQDADGQTSSTATVTVNVPDVTPGFVNFPNIAADQDHYTTSLPIQNVARFGNGDRTTQHTVNIATPAQHGSCTVTPANGTGAFVYTPNTGYVGSDSCVIGITDIDGQQGSVTANITVNRVITVTPKVGAASADPLSLSLCAVLPFLRRRRQAQVRRPRAGFRGWRVSALAGAMAALCGASFGGYGQTTPPPAKEPETKTTSAIGEIVVTARKIEENLKEVPLAITAFDSDTIAATGIASLGDVADLTPGLSFFNAFGDVLPVPVIRGVVPTDIFGQNNAAVFVDGIYVAGREGLNFDLVDVERIEVVKGPQSALYGRTAFSGAINYVSKRPSAELESKLSLEVGSAGKFKGSAMISGPLIGDTLRFRVAALVDDFDGTYRNALPDGTNIGGYRKRSYQGSLNWQPVSELEVNLGYYQANDHIDDPAIVSLPLNCEDQIQPPAGIPSQSDLGLPDIRPTPGVRLLNYCGAVPGIRSVPGMNGSSAIPKVSQATGEDRDLNRATLRIDWDLHEHGTISSLTGFSFTHDKSVSDFSRNLGYNQPFLFCSPASVDIPGNPNNCLDGTTFSPADKVFFAGTYNIAGGAKTSEWSQELRFTSPRDQRLRYTGGVYWYKSEVLDYPGTVLLALPQGNPDTNVQNLNEYLLKTYGSYGMPPFDASAPNFAIGTAIFYGSLTPDGGLDPKNRVSEKDETQGWAVFSGGFDLTEKLTLNGELRLNQEHQQNRTQSYTPCLDKNPATVAGCGDDYYNLNFEDAIYYDAATNSCTGLDGNAYATGRCSRIVAQTFQLITGRLGLKYKVTDDLMAYTSIAYGEKPGGERLISATVVCPTSGVLPKGCPSPDGTIPTVSPNPFGKESIIAYELGTKGTAFDRRVGFDVAVFFLDWKDIVLRQLTDVDPVTGLGFSQPTAFNVNAGSAHVLGTEASMQVSVTDNLRTDFTFGWTRAKIANARQDSYARFPTFRADCGPQPAPGLPNDLGNDEPLRKWWNDCNKISGDVSGNTLLRQPEYKASASLSYMHPLVGDWDWAGRVDATYQSGVYIGNENEAWLPSHAYVNAKLTVKSPKYSTNFWVRNMLNNGNAIAAFRDIYWANTNNLYPPYTNQGPRPNFSSFVPLRMSVSYPTERTIGVNFEARFGAAVK